VVLQNGKIPYVPLKKGHPSYEATLSVAEGVALQNGEIPYVPLKKGHPLSSYEVTFSLQMGVALQNGNEKSGLIRGVTFL
jgi:hypothetical protein